MRVMRATGLRAGALLGLLVLLAGVAACGDDDGSSGDTTEASADAPPPEDAGAGDGADEGKDDDEDAGGGDEQGTFADDFMSEVDDDDLPAEDAYAGYVEISDDTEALFVDVPEEFDDVFGEPDDEGEPRVDASTDLDGFFDGWDTSGLSYRSLGADTLGYTSSEDAYDDLIGTTDAADACRFEDRETFTESELDFTVGFYTDCGEPSSDAGEVFVFIDSDLPILHLTYVLADAADDEAFQEVLATFGYDSSRL